LHPTCSLSHSTSCSLLCRLSLSFFFFFNDTATPEIYTLSLHDALPISRARRSASPTRSSASASGGRPSCGCPARRRARHPQDGRSEEHTSELQSRGHLVCRLLLEKKKKKLQN